MVSIWGRVISVSARDQWPDRYLLYPGSPSATLRAPPRFPGSPVFQPVTLMTGIGILQLAPDWLLPVLILPVRLILVRFLDMKLSCVREGNPWGPCGPAGPQAPRRSAGGRTRRCDRAGGEPAGVRRRLRASPGSRGGRAPMGGGASLFIVGVPLKCKYEGYTGIAPIRTARKTRHAVREGTTRNTTVDTTFLAIQPVRKQSQY